MLERLQADAAWLVSTGTRVLTIRAFDEMISERCRRRRRPDMVLGDRGYDHDKYRHIVWDLGVKPLFTRPARQVG